MGSPASTRLDDDVAERLERYAEQRGISKSQALGELAENGLELTGDDGPDLNAESDVQHLVELAEEFQQTAEQVEQKANAQTQQVQRMLDSHIDLADVDRERIEAFADQPYKVLPKAENEAWVVTPRFVPFNIGWLHEQDDAWNVFVVNKYIDWIDDLPETLRDEVGIDAKYDEVAVMGTDIELSSEAERDRAWDDLGGGGKSGPLYQKKGETKIQIKQGKEFDVIAALIEEGNLPFAPRPIQDGDLQPEPDGIDLRDYQVRAWEKFRETGMIGVYWPPGAGKTFLGLYAGERVNGRKLVIVPSSTLKEQWQERIKEFCDSTWRWDVQTYQYFNYEDNLDEYQNKDIALTIFDEVHHLPANTFSKLATLGTKYRIGLSASPYREDGRTEYIFALTGFPVGMNWDELVELGVVDKPTVNVYLYRTQRQKRNDLPNVVGERAGKTVVFCDGIDAGKRVSGDLGVPFIHGETSNRMDKLRENRVSVVSRVGDEGVSLDDIRTVIEFDFHGGSRRQEIQRIGRVMHSDDDAGEHIIMMTDEEYEKYGKRLYSAEEQGFQVQFDRRE